MLRRHCLLFTLLHLAFFMADVTAQTRGALMVAAWDPTGSTSDLVRVTQTTGGTWIASPYVTGVAGQVKRMSQNPTDGTIYAMTSNTIYSVRSPFLGGFGAPTPNVIYSAPPGFVMEDMWVDRSGMTQANLSILVIGRDPTVIGTMATRISLAGGAPPAPVSLPSGAFPSPQIQSPKAIAVQPITGNLFVIDAGSRLFQYNGSFGYVSDAALSGSPSIDDVSLNLQFPSAAFFTVGSSGGAGTIRQYSILGGLTSTLPVQSGFFPISIATDQAGDLFVLSRNPSTNTPEIRFHDATGAFSTPLPASSFTQDARAICWLTKAAQEVTIMNGGLGLGLPTVQTQTPSIWGVYHNSPFNVTYSITQPTGPDPFLVIGTRLLPAPAALGPNGNFQVDLADPGTVSILSVGAAVTFAPLTSPTADGVRLYLQWLGLNPTTGQVIASELLTMPTGYEPVE